MASINVMRDRLYLLAKLPMRDGSPGLKQQRIALRLDDTPINRRSARTRLAELEKQLATGTFAWAYWLPEADQATTVTWTEGIRRLHHKKVVLGRTSETTWAINYMGRLRQLPGQERITPQAITKALGRYQRHQCSYKELYYLLKHLATLVNCPFPEVPVPTYDHSPTPEVPSDPEIVDWVLGASPGAAWTFGMMATYGLRPHEVAVATFIDGDRIQVPEGTKTGHRTVIPLPGEWVELFNLRERRLPPGRTELARYLWRELRNQGLPWRPYALRHAYAARLWRAGGGELDLFTAARLMGHSISQHVKTYRAHIDPNTIALAAEDAIARHQAKVTRRLEAAAALPAPAPPRRG